MNGIHDMGGMHGFGTIMETVDAPQFHEEWERRTMGLVNAMMAGFQFSVDEFRYAIERMAPAHYLGSSYYEHWLEGTMTLLLEKGVFSQAELDARLADLSTEQNGEPA
ncbi:MAG: nitrile hydratase subunit beta [Alphaproteobacteria bacterium]|jgi:nitrile hydratase|nr:nitrile hydratase subunit beta [Alphaproteobacteria bacterium]MDP6829784.1 nitrile hydratase subunit beta [Alphaproteobacteria bacterium]MDP6872518.1 nitrile hydratase subunit beta [Alphaproteobacteria bacterium]